MIGGIDLFRLFIAGMFLIITIATIAAVFGALIFVLYSLVMFLGILLAG